MTAQAPIGMFIDCEIKHGVLVEGDTVRDMDYCEGWGDYVGMGLASTTILTSTDAIVMLHDAEHELLSDILRNVGETSTDSDRILVTFNGMKFDVPLMAANGVDVSRYTDDTHHYDLLREMWKADGNDPDHFEKGTHANYGLHHTCVRNGLNGKEGHAADAPYLFQRGRIGQLLSYNLDDVRKLSALYRLAHLFGGLQGPHGWIDLSPPELRFSSELSQ